MDPSARFRLFPALLRGAVLLLALLLMIISLDFKRDSPTTKAISYLDVMEVSVDGGPWQKQALPHLFRDLTPGTSVRLRTTISPIQDDGVYVRSQRAKAQVYLDGELVFTLGKAQNYPTFMPVPATEIHVVETYGTGEAMDLCIEYFSPETDSTLFVEPPMVGSSKELILERSQRSGEAWTLALVQIIGGIALMLISVWLLIIDRKGILFTCLGLFSSTTGLWFLGTNSFAITVFPASSWLYLTAYIGFIVCLIPLLQFTRFAVEFQDPRPLIYLEDFFTVSALAALMLQLCGLCPLHKSWALYRFLTPAALTVLAILLLLERLRRHSRSAGRFFYPTAALAATAVLDLAINHFRPEITVFPIFQIGVTLFLLMVGVIAGLSMKDNIDLQKREQQLLHEKQLLDIQTEEQRASSLLLVQTEEELSRQRHDLRHHLAAIQELSRDNSALQDYLSALMEQLPQTRERFCENTVVNAVISHYASRCEQTDIAFSCRLVVPNTGNQTTDSKLCVIFSNLLENAVEACNRMDGGEKHITIQSRLQGPLLSIVMENSFNGIYTRIGSRFRSSKRNDYGVGLTSIQTLAREAQGDTEFRAEDKTFISSVYLTLF